MIVPERSRWYGTELQGQVSQKRFGNKLTYKRVVGSDLIKDLGPY